MTEPKQASTARASALRFVFAITVTLLGVALFFVLVGVFGLPAAIPALLLFVTLALPIFRRPQAWGRSHDPRPGHPRAYPVRLHGQLPA